MKNYQDEKILLLWHGTTQFGSLRDLNAFHDVRIYTINELRKRSWLKLNINLSSIDLEWIDRNDKSFLYTLNELSEVGKIYLWNSGYSHNIPSLHHDIWQRNLRLGLSVFNNYFGLTPDAFYPVELYISKGTLRSIKCLGFNYTIFSAKNSLKTHTSVNDQFCYKLSDITIFNSNSRPSSTNNSTHRSFCYSHDWESKFLTTKFRANSIKGITSVSEINKTLIDDYFNWIDEQFKNGKKFILPNNINDGVEIQINEINDLTGINFDDPIRLTGVCSFIYPKSDKMVHPVSLNGHREVSNMPYNTLDHKKQKANVISQIIKFNSLSVNSNLIEQKAALNAACSDWLTGASSNTVEEQILIPYLLLKKTKVTDQNILSFRNNLKNISYESVFKEFTQIESFGSYILSSRPNAGTIYVDPTDYIDNTDFCYNNLYYINDKHFFKIESNFKFNELYHLEVELISLNEKIISLYYLSPADGNIEKHNREDGSKLFPYGNGVFMIETNIQMYIISVCPNYSCPAIRYERNSLFAVYSQKTQVKIKETTILHWSISIQKKMSDYDKFKVLYDAFDELKNNL